MTKTDCLKVLNHLGAISKIVEEVYYKRGMLFERPVVADFVTELECHGFVCPENGKPALRRAWELGLEHAEGIYDTELKKVVQGLDDYSCMLRSLVEQIEAAEKEELDGPKVPAKKATTRRTRRKRQD